MSAKEIDAKEQLLASTLRMLTIITLNRFQDSLNKSLTYCLTTTNPRWKCCWDSVTGFHKQSISRVLAHFAGFTQRPNNHQAKRGDRRRAESSQLWYMNSLACGQGFF